MSAPGEIGELLASGEELVEQSRPEEALARYDRALELDPRNTGALERKVFVLTGQGRREEALRCQEQLVALDPGNPERRVIHADLLLMTGDSDGAIASLEEAVQLVPRDPGILQRLGHAFRSSGQGDRALATYDRALALAPEDSHLWATKADALIDAGRADEAVEALERAARFDPEFLDADWNQRADRFYMQGQFDRAAQLYRRAIEVRPNVTSWRGLGLTFQAAQDFQEALRCYERALELEPDSVQLLNDRGYMLVELGDTAQAQECFRQVVEHAPESLEGWMNLGWTYRETDQPVEAHDAYSRAARLDPGNAETWLNVGLCELEIGERTAAMQKALVSFERAAELDPGMFWAWNNAGWVLGELGDYDEAMRRLDRAIELDRTEVTPWRNKTMLYLQHDQPDAAERCLEEMVGTVSDLAAALNVKAAVLTDWLGRDEEALEVSEQAARLRPGDESITANIAETLLKLGRWGKARKTAQQVLARTASVNTRSVMLFLIWASHVLDDGGSGARARTFGEFMDYYREHFVDGPGRPMEWTYRGLKRAIPDRAPSAEAAFLVTLVIDLQEARLPVGELTFFGAQDQLVAAR